MAGEIRQLNAWLLAVLIGAASSPVLAADADANAEGKAFAKARNEAVVNDLGTTTDPTFVPGYTTSDVPERELYTHGAAIEDDAAAAVGTSEPGQFVSGSMTSRPNYTIDSATDPMLQRHEEIEQQANSLTDTYSGCVELPVGTENTTTSTTATCQAFATLVTHSCTRTRTFTCPTGALEDGTCPASGISIGAVPPGVSATYTGGQLVVDGTGPWGTHCLWKTKTITFHVDDASAVHSFILREAKFRGDLYITLNGSFVFYEEDYDGPVDDGEEIGMCWGAWFGHSTPNTDHKASLVDGVNTLEITTRGNFGNHVYARFEAATAQEEAVVETCPDGFDPGGVIPNTEICTEPAETRLIGGVPIYRECWAWQTEYHDPDASAGTLTEDAACGALRDAGCYIIGSVCDTTHPTGFCQEQTLTFQCDSTSPTRTVALCGSQYVCPEGECADEYQVVPDPTADMQRGVTALSMAAEVGNGFDESKMTIFKGQGMECQKDKFGFADCCADSGWGIDLGLSECSSEEEQLGIAKQEGRTHYIGSYEDGPWYNEKKYKSYCVYSSKLSRIIIEQGKAQLGQGYGSPKHPKCTGFTVAEFASLDLEAMDLSEWYADAAEKAHEGEGNIPDQNELIEQLRATYGGAP